MIEPSLWINLKCMEKNFVGYRETLGDNSCIVHPMILIGQGSWLIVLHTVVEEMKTEMERKIVRY